MMSKSDKQQKKRGFTRIEDSKGSFVLGRANVIKGTDSECLSVSSVNSSNSVFSSPRSDKVSKFGGTLKRDR